MKGFISFMLKFIAVVAILAAALYWLNYFLAAMGKKNFCIKELLPKKELKEKAVQQSETPASCNCNDAICAVDMCMPY